MQFRVATLNPEQDHKRWDARRELIQAEIGRLKPDIMAFNEVCIPLQSARGLRDATTSPDTNWCSKPGATAFQRSRARLFRALRRRERDERRIAAAVSPGPKSPV